MVNLMSKIGRFGLTVRVGGSKGCQPRVDRWTTDLSRLGGNVINTLGGNVINNLRGSVINLVPEKAAGAFNVWVEACCSRGEL